MTLEFLRGLSTVLAFVAFVAICVWAYSRKRHADFEQAALLPFADELLPFAHELVPFADDLPPFVKGLAPFANELVPFGNEPVPFADEPINQYAVDHDLPREEKSV